MFVRVVERAVAVGLVDLIAPGVEAVLELYLVIGAVGDALGREPGELTFEAVNLVETISFTEMGIRVDDLHRALPDIGPACRARRQLRAFPEDGRKPLLLWPGP